MRNRILVPSVSTMLLEILILSGACWCDYQPWEEQHCCYRDPESGKKLDFLTNNFCLPPLTIAELYRLRWQVELFFKWIKQHLRIKSFFGTSDNAVRTQIWTAISVYLLVAIARKRLGIERDLSTILYANF